MRPPSVVNVRPSASVEEGEEQGEEGGGQETVYWLKIRYFPRVSHVKKFVKFFDVRHADKPGAWELA